LLARARASCDDEPLPVVALADHGRLRGVDRSVAFGDVKRVQPGRRRVPPGALLRSALRVIERSPDEAELLHDLPQDGLSVLVVECVAEVPDQSVSDLLEHLAAVAVRSGPRLGG
jgi:hypothetical protein